MAGPGEMETLAAQHIEKGDHGSSDYFRLIKELVKHRNRNKEDEREYIIWQEEIDRIYELVRDELVTNQAKPRTPVKFGTSGWRGIIGKDLYLKSVCQVTQAILSHC